MIDTARVNVGIDSAAQPSRHAAPLYALVCGASVRVTGVTPLMRARLAALLRPFLMPVRNRTDLDTADITIHLERAPNKHGWRIFLDGMFLTLAPDSLYLIAHLEWLVISRAIERSTEYVAFHAASLAWKRRAVILVAPSGSGKTTLTAGLASRGWRPLADDLTVVDIATRAAHPFRRCFHADPFTRGVIEAAIPARAPVAALPDYVRPSHWAPDPCEPAWVVIVRRDPEEAAGMRPVTRAQAAGALFTSAIRNGMSRSEIARLSATLGATISGCWELNNSDLDATLDLLDQTLRHL